MPRALAIDYDFVGGYSEEGTPDPIPNSEAKLFSADGTAGEAWWESRSPPTFLLKKPVRKSGLFCFLLKATTQTKKRSVKDRTFSLLPPKGVSPSPPELGYITLFGPRPTSLRIFTKF